MLKYLVTLFGVLFPYLSLSYLQIKELKTSVKSYGILPLGKMR